ncbi:amidohydrolase [Halalkalicoccus sp. NIPERK01]|uniref:amidohydrolase n=1 Tax=Halalkalicoccus sp. NIPERK01 TaxID=3053469 RepID=UPI00256F10E6|nr:amidohydrolase [Halalkalicoccus sp. NIPERK01]MDL5363243.1 amidohydrolase [Halalkalicoccus sp. NIPERK01]
MTDLLITNGTIITQNEDRQIIIDGAVAVTGDRITDVGSADRLEAETSPDQLLDAEGGAVIPGLINAHTHVSDIFLRGAFTQDRGLYDWLFNVKQPALFEMRPEEHALAAQLYCIESIQSGITTFVENDTALDWTDLEPTRRKLDVYDDMGVRNIYGAGIRDLVPDRGFEQLFEDITARDPRSVHPGSDALIVETEDALDNTAALIEEFHDTEGRQSVWPAPATLATTTSDALQGAYRLAEEYDVMTTTHVAEAKAEVRERGALSSIEYLRNIGCLGDRALLGHCVQMNARDVRLLARSGTAVVHNYRANMRLATGFAPVVSMLDTGVLTAIGTDNSILNDTVNLLSDAGAVATAHKGYHRDSSVIPAQKAFDMVTCDAAEAIGHAENLGSIEAGKRADIAIVDLDKPHLTPSPDPVHALVYGAQGSEVETVLCAGTVLMQDREIIPIDVSLSAVLADATATAEDLIGKAKIE